VVLRAGSYSCGNDMVCSWAGAFGCEDGISVIAGTGSIAYGEYHGRAARAGGWGEVFGDEGSAYWIAREGLAAFSRMSDGRSPTGPLKEMVREHFQLKRDIDLAGLINGLSGASRTSIAQLCQLIGEAAAKGDDEACEIYRRAGGELASIVIAVRHNLNVPPAETVPVSYTGGVFATGERILRSFAAALDAADDSYRLQPPLLEPVLGAAVYAARCAGVHFEAQTLQRLAHL
jgi:N-acetylglucosamine kinase-like BadF-type ATPase